MEQEKYCGEPNSWQKCGCCNNKSAVAEPECKCEYTILPNGMKKCVRCGVTLTQEGKRVSIKLG